MKANPILARHVSIQVFDWKVKNFIGWQYLAFSLGQQICLFKKSLFLVISAHKQRTLKSGLIFRADMTRKRYFSTRQLKSTWSIKFFIERWIVPTFQICSWFELTQEFEMSFMWTCDRIPKISRFAYYYGSWRTEALQLRTLW